mmetsp:Transcript_20113/g.42197  ORF Transcript_20113/g.42197 Transcript_20113/m.42197 type:complete len:295 (+) Transcript_20113:157-1041(+)
MLMAAGMRACAGAAAARGAHSRPQTATDCSPTPPHTSPSSVPSRASTRCPTGRRTVRRRSSVSGSHTCSSNRWPASSGPNDPATSPTPHDARHRTHWPAPAGYTARVRRAAQSPPSAQTRTLPSTEALMRREPCTRSAMTVSAWPASVLMCSPVATSQTRMLSSHEPLITLSSHTARHETSPRWPSSVRSHGHGLRASGDMAHRRTVQSSEPLASREPHITSALTPSSCPSRTCSHSPFDRSQILTFPSSCPLIRLSCQTAIDQTAAPCSTSSAFSSSRVFLFHTLIASSLPPL